MAAHGATLGRVHGIVLPAILPTRHQFVPTYANHVDTRERDDPVHGAKAKYRRREREREDILSVCICHDARTIAGKIITVFTAERIHWWTGVRTGCSRRKVDRHISNASIRARITCDETRKSVNCVVISRQDVESAPCTDNRGIIINIFPYRMFSYCCTVFSLCV